jgi:hypothetical protein
MPRFRVAIWTYVGSSSNEPDQVVTVVAESEGEAITAALGDTPLSTVYRAVALAEVDPSSAT